MISNLLADATRVTQTPPLQLAYSRVIALRKAQHPYDPPKLTSEIQSLLRLLFMRGIGKADRGYCIPTRCNGLQDGARSLVTTL